MALDLTPVSVAWLGYAVAAAALLAAALRSYRLSPGVLGLALLLGQQVLGTTAAVVMFTAESAPLALSAFHAGAFVWLLWSPLVFLAAPLLLHGATQRARVARVVGILGAAPSLLLLAAAAWDRSVLFTADGYALTPLAVRILLLVFVAFAATVALLAWEALATPAPLRRAQFTLLAAAFAGEGAFHAFQNGAKLVSGADFHGYLAVSSWEFALTSAAVVALIGTASGAAYAWVTSREKERKGWARFLTVFILAAAVTGVATAPLIAGEEFRHPSGALHATWDLAALCLLVFAALRYQLFDAEVRAKQGLAVTFSLGLGVLMFAAVEALVEDFLVDAYLGGLPAAGVVAAIVVTIASVTLTRAGKTLARRVLPNVTGAPDYERLRREEIYQAALEGALLDGHLSTQEANSLTRLRGVLGVTLDDHARLEARVLGTLGHAAPAGAARAAV